MATRSSILAWRSPMDRGAWRAAVHGGHDELDTTERLSTQHTRDGIIKETITSTGEGLKTSCPRGNCTQMFIAVYPQQPKSGDHPKAHQRGNRSAKSGLLIQRAIHNSGDGNGNPPQFSRLENPMDGGAWRATDHGVAGVGHD